MVEGSKDIDSRLFEVSKRSQSVRS